MASQGNRSDLFDCDDAAAAADDETFDVVNTLHQGQLSLPSIWGR